MIERGCASNVVFPTASYRMWIVLDAWTWQRCEVSEIVAWQRKGRSRLQAFGIRFRV